ncbi:MAG: heavy metal translocating P-type ATPase [Sphaerochaetaceae bacterium]
MENQYDVTGMTCASCALHVEKSVSKIQGVSDVKVNLMDNSMTVSFDDDMQEGDTAVIRAVRLAGYDASAQKSKERNGDQQPKSTVFDEEVKSLRKRLIISLAAAIPLFYISMGHMFDWPLPSFLLGAKHSLVFALTQLLLVLPIVGTNWAMFTNGFRALLKRAPTMDSLIAIGSSAALAYGVVLLYRMSFALGNNDLSVAGALAMELYFESAGMILTLVLLGKYLEAKAKRRTGEAVRRLMDLAPKRATVLQNGKEQIVDIQDIAVGDIVIAKPGERIAVDGIVIKGFSALDESALTGESIPIEKQQGDRVLSASINTSGYIQYRAERVGENTTLSHIIQLVRHANATKAPIARLADKISGVFVPIVIVIAVVSSAVWLFAGFSFSFALSIGISVLVISCPCALGLATPAAIMVGTGKGAENGILATSGEALQTLRDVDTVVLDKTGTITEGKPKVTDIILGEAAKEEQVIALAAAAEQASEHPVAYAIIEKANTMNVTYEQPSVFKALSGLGVEAMVGTHHILVGNKTLMDRNELSVAHFEQDASRLTYEGKTPFYVAKDNSAIGLIAVADSIKDTSISAIDAMKRMHLDVVMLSGDNRITANAIAARVGITNIIANVLPDEKAYHIEQLMNQGKTVAMVGDGINDAPALASAHIGIAIGSGSDIAKESADVVLMKNNLNDVVSAIQLGKAVLRNIKENLFWALFYNSLGIPLAAGVFYLSLGWKMNPMFAAAAMSLSSLFVVGNALRLGLFKPTTAIDMKKKRSKRMERELLIEKMTCQHCSMRVKKALDSLPGVQSTVDLATKIARIKTDKPVTDAQLKDAVEQAGYDVVSIR